MGEDSCIILVHDRVKYFNLFQLGKMGQLGITRRTTEIKKPLVSSRGEGETQIDPARSLMLWASRCQTRRGPRRQRGALQTERLASSLQLQQRIIEETKTHQRQSSTLGRSPWRVYRGRGQRDIQTENCVEAVPRHLDRFNRLSNLSRF